MYRLLKKLKNVFNLLISFKRIFRIYLSLILDFVITLIILIFISNFTIYQITISFLLIIFLNFSFGIYINNLRRSLLFNNIKLLLSFSSCLIFFLLVYFGKIAQFHNLNLSNIFSSISITYFLFFCWRTLFLYFYEKLYSQDFNKKKIILFIQNDDIEFVQKVIDEFNIVAICDFEFKTKQKTKFKSIPYINSIEIKKYLKKDIRLMVSKSFFYESNNFKFLEKTKSSVIIYNKISHTKYEILDPDIPFLLNKQFDYKKIDNAPIIKNRTILITGAGGTIGGELLRQCLNYFPAKLVILDHDEFSIYQITNKFDSKSIHPIVGSITNLKLLNYLFKNFDFDYVFHCAAYKHVNLVQKNFYSAFYNNVIGTINIAKNVIKSKKTKLIFVSTDKAIIPSSTMGASKRICELYLMSFYKKNNKVDNLRIVRFGNVIGSKGSFIPKLVDQIKNNQTITITHNKVQRYFMTVDQAVGLILSSINLNNYKESIFTFRMGKSIKIKTLVQKIIKYSGYYISLRDAKIIFSNLNSGEKLNEILFSNKKKYVETLNKDIFLEYQNSPPHNEILNFINQCIKDAKDNKTMINNLIKFSKKY